MLQTTIKDTWLEIDGLRIHCFVAGESGSPVILLHGGGLDSATISWRASIGSLSAHQRVFAPDLPGYGQSDKPAVEYTLDYYVNFLAHFMDALHLDKASLIGLSLGFAWHRRIHRTNPLRSASSLKSPSSKVISDRESADTNFS
jgi:pimeloyl-ACP methyl ester carboxylesterase